MKKTQFRSSALRVVATSVDVEKGTGNSKRKVEHEMTANLVHESVTPYLESAHKYIKFICDGLYSSSALKSDLVKGWPVLITAT